MIVPQKKNKSPQKIVRDPDDPYNPKLNTGSYNKIPACIYFYFIEPEHKTADGIVRDIWHYYYAEYERSIDIEEVEYIVRNLSLNATLPRLDQVPPPDGYGFQNLVWTRKSYIVFFSNDPKFNFKKGGGITFDQPGGFAFNYSFFDAWDMDFDFGQGNRTAVGCINHMKKDESGLDLGRAKRRYHFNLVPDKRPIFFPDSGGTNMGPPVGPP